MHDVKVERLDVYAHRFADLVSVGIVRDDFVAVGKKGDLIVVALEYRRYDFCGENGAFVVNLFDLDVLGTNDDVDGFVVFEALVHALENGVAKFDFAIFKHSARKNGAFTDEVCNERVCRLVVHFFGRRDLLNFTKAHNDDFVGHRESFFLVVRNENRRYARFALNTLDFLTSLKSEARVEVGKRFVQQKNVGHLNERASDCHTLLLAARKLGRLSCHQLFDLHQTSGVESFFFCLLFGNSHVEQGEHDVLSNRHVRIQSVVLENQADTSSFGSERRYVLFVEKDVALRGRFQARKHKQRRRFSATGRAEKSDELSGRNFDRHIVDRNDGFTFLFS